MTTKASKLIKEIHFSAIAQNPRIKSLLTMLINWEIGTCTGYMQKVSFFP